MGQWDSWDSWDNHTNKVPLLFLGGDIGGDMRSMSLPIGVVGSWRVTQRKQ
ncbi:MAG: hypothetical protein JNK00_12390 [Flavipsychrobacter sp.]|nr:hypothetical protein [Flavipsychrobacter sp.]